MTLRRQRSTLTARSHSMTEFSASATLLSSTERLAHHLVCPWRVGVLRELGPIVIGRGYSGQQFIQQREIGPVLCRRDGPLNPVSARDEGGVDRPHGGPALRPGSPPPPARAP